MSLMFVKQPIAVESSRYSPDADSTNPLHSFGQSNESDGRFVSHFLDSTSVSPAQDHVTHALHRLYNQRTKLAEFYNREIDLGEVTEKLVRFIDQIDLLLHQYDQDRSNLHSFNLPNAANRTFDEENYVEYLKEIGDSNDVELLVDETAPIELHENSYSRSDGARPVKSTIGQLKRFKYKRCCPLTSRTYGLDPHKHGVRQFPCMRHTAPLNLYKHFVQYHHLTHSAAMRIVRVIADGKDERDVDLFSHSSNSLVATHPTIHRAQCPLNAYGKFGIMAEHRVRLCTQPSQTLGTPKDICLYDHFVIFHQMKRSCAQRLAEAILRNRTGAVFRPDEQILNETFHVQCPLRHPRTICWNVPIATRHMGQHLTSIHKVDRSERQRLLAALRQTS